MKSLFGLTQKNSVPVRAVALVLLVATLTIPQLAWADHTSDLRMMDSAFLAMNPELSSYQRFFAASGQDEAAAASSARWAALGSSYSEANEASSARWVALGSSYSEANEVDSARWAALAASYSADKGTAFLAVNPE